MSGSSGMRSRLPYSLVALAAAVLLTGCGADVSYDERQESVGNRGQRGTYTSEPRETVFGPGGLSPLRADLVAHWYLTEGAGTTFENLGEPTEGVPEDFDGYVAGAGGISWAPVSEDANGNRQRTQQRSSLVTAHISDYFPPPRRK